MPQPEVKPEQKAENSITSCQIMTHSQLYMNDITCKLHRKCNNWRVLDFPTQGKKYLLYRCPYLKEVRVRMRSAPGVKNSPNHLVEKLCCTIRNMYSYIEQKETASYNIVEVWSIKQCTKQSKFSRNPNFIFFKCPIIFKYLRSKVSS